MILELLLDSFTPGEERMERSGFFPSAFLPAEKDPVAAPEFRAPEGARGRRIRGVGRILDVVGSVEVHAEKIRGLGECQCLLLGEGRKARAQALPHDGRVGPDGDGVRKPT